MLSVRTWGVVPALCSALVAAGCARHIDPKYIPTPTPNARSSKRATAPPAELAKLTGIAEGTVRAIGRHGANLRRLVGETEEGDERPASGVVLDLAGDDWHAAVKALRAELGSGYQVFCKEQGFNIKPTEVAVLRGTDQFEALRTMSTSGPNYDISPKQVLERAKQWDQAYGLVVMGAGIDWMEAELKRPPADMLAFAREVYKFCPDSVDQGAGTVEKLADEMRRSKSVYLWWD